jgi:hypothetical protein
MKYKLTKPNLSIKDLSKLNFIASYLGYNLKYQFDDDICNKAFFENEEDKNIGYIQRDSKDRLFIIWKHNENIQYVDIILNIVGNLKKNYILPYNLNDKKEKIKMALGIQSLTNSCLTPEIKKYLCMS